jgi:hypothetical protein
MPADSPIPEPILLEACRILFGTEIDRCRDFLHGLRPEGVKAAFRARAKESHPDRYAGCPAEVGRERTARFREAARAYQLLGRFCAQRDAGGATEPAPEPGIACYPHPRVPSHPLEFGRFLYHRGKITYQELTAALIWQRRQRPSLGALARHWGWLDQARLDTILRDRKPALRIGQRALQLGYLNTTQLQVLLRYQRSLQRKLGQYFVEQGLLTAAEVEKLVQDLRLHNGCLGSRDRQTGWYRAV